MPTGIYKRTDENLKAIRAFNKTKLGKLFSLKARKNMSKARMGIKFSETHRKNLSKARLGKVPWNKRKEYPQVTGKNNYKWKGGITPLVMIVRHRFQYRQWVSDVLTRDNFTCQECGIKESNLEAHHIKDFSIIFKENNIQNVEQALNCDELWNINNGKTLCLKCHNLTKKNDTISKKI